MITVPFEIEKAKRGEKVMTRNGHPARVVCFDRKGSLCSLVVLITFGDLEMPHCYTENGIFYSEDSPHDMDLVIIIKE